MLCSSAGVGRAGTFCIIYTAICELNGTGNIGKNITILDAFTLSSSCLLLLIGQLISAYNYKGEMLKYQLHFTFAFAGIFCHVTLPASHTLFR